MKKCIFISVIFFICLASNANSSVIDHDDRQSRTYSTGHYKGLYLEGNFSVRLIQGDQSSLTVYTSDPKAFDYLKVSNRGDLLHINVDRKPFDFTKVTLDITLIELERLVIRGGMNLETAGYLSLNDLSVIVEGGAQIDFKTKADDIKIKSEGGVLFDISGVGGSLDVMLAGAGHIDAGQLEAAHVDFLIEGVGTGVVYATKSLNARIKGVGKLKYRGNPRVTKIVEGLGSVKKSEE